MSSEAVTEVAGRYRANSAAMLGPERTASGQSQRGVASGRSFPFLLSTSAMICVGRSSVLFSIPLATDTIGTFGGKCRPTRCQTSRMYCVGTAESTIEQFSKQSISLAVRRTFLGTCTPGRKRRFSRFWISRSTDSSNAPHMTTSWPRWLRRTEQTVAMAPSPRMVMLSLTVGAFDRDGRVNSIGGMSEPGVSDLLSVAQAIVIIDATPVSPRVVEVPLQEAQGLRLAEDLR